jgi:hypothetical protein
MDYQLINLVSNLGVLTVVGILYASYVKNLKSEISLKSEQLKLAEQNIKLWKDKAMISESHTPQFIEQQLGSRIKTREDEIKRLSKDQSNNADIILRKETEIAKLNEKILKAQEFMEEYFCESCRSPMVERHFVSESVEHNGKDVDIEHEYTSYECGFTIVDGHQTKPCRFNNETK